MDNEEKVVRVSKVSPAILAWRAECKVNMQLATHQMHLWENEYKEVCKHIEDLEKFYGE